MQKDHFLLVKKFENTESAQLWTQICRASGQTGQKRRVKHFYGGVFQFYG